jgi:hypothetical protein
VTAMGGEGTTLDSLLAWLLPEISCGGEESGGANGGGGHLERRERGDPRMFAELLFRLAQNRFQAGPTVAEDINRREDSCNGLEDRLLEASLIKTIVSRCGDKMKNSSPNTTSAVDKKGVFIDKEALDKITSSLLGDVSSVLDAFDGSGPCIVSGIHEAQILLAFLDSSNSNNNDNITASRTMLLTQRLWTKLLASTAKLLLSSKKSENNSFENKLTLLTAWEGLVETVGGLRCSALRQALLSPSTGKQSSLLDLVNVVEAGLAIKKNPPKKTHPNKPT